MRVWHDNTGPSPAWYLTQIQVQDLQSGQSYIFPANTWLSLEMEDGMLQKELCAAGELWSHSDILVGGSGRGIRLAIMYYLFLEHST